ncbi:MAG: hypothetical protein V1839_00465 [archaeon]
MAIAAVPSFYDVPINALVKIVLKKPMHLNINDNCSFSGEYLIAEKYKESLTIGSGIVNILGQYLGIPTNIGSKSGSEDAVLVSPFMNRDFTISVHLEHIDSYDKIGSVEDLLIDFRKPKQ